MVIGGRMQFSLDNWLTITAICVTVVGIIIAVIIGIIQILKKDKTNPVNISQKMGPFSKGSQTANYSNNQAKDNE